MLQAHGFNNKNSYELNRLFYGNFGNPQKSKKECVNARILNEVYFHLGLRCFHTHAKLHVHVTINVSFKDEHLLPIYNIYYSRNKYFSD